jgi:hypothetical protein
MGTPGGRIRERSTMSSAEYNNTTREFGYMQKVTGMNRLREFS